MEDTNDITMDKLLYSIQTNVKTMQFMRIFTVFCVKNNPLNFLFFFIFTRLLGIQFRYRTIINNNKSI